MGVIDDIKNMKPVSNKVITKKDFDMISKALFNDINKEHDLSQVFEEVVLTKVYKEVGVGKYEFVGFKYSKPVSNKVFTIKDLIKIVKSTRWNGKGNKKHNKVIYQREKVEQDDDDERRNAIK